MLSQRNFFLINFLFSNMNTYIRIMLHKKLPFCLNWIRGFCVLAACARTQQREEVVGWWRSGEKISQKLQHTNLQMKPFFIAKVCSFLLLPLRIQALFEIHKTPSSARGEGDEKIKFKLDVCVQRGGRVCLCETNCSPFN